MLKKMVDDIIDKFEKDTKIANENLVNFRTTKEAMKARKRIEKHEQIRHCLAMVKDLGFDEESDEFFTATTLFKEDHNRQIFTDYSTNAARLKWLNK